MAGPWEAFAAPQTKQAPPTYQYEGPQAAANLQGKTVENTKTTATLPYDIQSAKNAAAKSGLDVQSAQYDLQSKTGAPPGNPSLTGQAYINSLPPGVKDMTQAMLSGRYASPINTRNPIVMQATLAAMHADNNFDAARYNERLALLKNSYSGPLAQSINALNTAIMHGGMLYDQSTGPAGHDLGFGPLSKSVNAVQNWVNSTDPGLTNYEDTLQKYAPEAAKAYQVNTGAERQDMAGPFNINYPTATKQADIKNDIHLFGGKMSAILHQFNIGNGADKPSIDLLSPEARAVLQRISPETIDQYFAKSPDPTAQALGVSAFKGPQNPTGGNQGGFGPGGGGDNQPPPGPPPIGPGGNTPSGGPPTADYSGMTGAPQQGIAQDGMRQEFNPTVAAGMAALIRKGAPYEQAQAYSQSQGFNAPSEKDYAAALAFQKQHPNAAPNVEASREVPTTAWQRFSGGPAAAAITGFGAGSTAGLQDVVGRIIAGPAWDANRAALEATNPKASMLGNIVGGTAGMLEGGNAIGGLLRAGTKGGAARNSLAWLLQNPVKANAFGDTAYGATYGASENPDNPLAGAGVGALTGLPASLVGQYGSKAIGNVLTGVTNPAVQRLQALGIPLTAGEVLGGGFKKAQDAATSVFGPGSMVSRRYAEGRNAMNQAAFNEGGSVIGAPINAVGNEGIAALNAAKSNAYSSALDPISLNLNTPSFVGPMKGILAGADAIPAGELPQGYAGNAIRNFVGNNVLPNGTMSGADFQKAYRGLAQTANKAAPKIEGNDISQSLRQANDILTANLQTQNPGAFEGFLAANQANRNLNVLANAVNAAKNQIDDRGNILFTPAQLGTAATANARNYSGNIAAASGNRPFDQLIRDSQQVMSSKLPESGTFPRFLLGAALTGGLSAPGGAAGYGLDGGQGALEGAAIPLTLGTLLGSRAGQKALVGMLTKRPELARSLGDLAINRPGYLASLSTSAQVPYFTTP